MSKKIQQLPVLVLVIIALSVAAVVTAIPPFEKPQLSLSLRDGYYDSLLDSFEPTLTWKHSFTVGGEDNTSDDNGSGGGRLLLPSSCDVDLGIETLLYPTTNVKTLPKSIWGKITTRIGNVWDVSGRIETTPLQTGMQCQVDNVELDFSARISASKINAIGKIANNGDGHAHPHGTEMSLDCIEAIKGITIGGAGNNKHHFTVNPRYVFSGHASTAGSTSDIVFGYKTNDNLTSLQIVASKHNQEVTIQHQHKNTNVRIIADTGDYSITKPSLEVTASHQLNLQNIITPTISTEDGISVEYERKFGINNHNSLTSTINTSTRTLSMEYKDHGWTANIQLPFVSEGSSLIEGATVNIKRDIVLF